MLDLFNKILVGLTISLEKDGILLTDYKDDVYYAYIRKDGRTEEDVDRLGRELKVRLMVAYWMLVGSWADMKVRYKGVSYMEFKEKEISMAKEFFNPSKP